MNRVNTPYFRRTKRVATLLITGFSVAFFMMIQPALADLRICNNSSNRISVALAYLDQDKWISEGWWNLKPNVCEALLRGPLAEQFYYVYAMDERGGEWKGKTFMCTSDREFKIEGRKDCYANGHDRTGFFEIDTGKDTKNWTVQLTDPSKPISGQ